MAYEKSSSIVDVGRDLRPGQMIPTDDLKAVKPMAPVKLWRVYFNSRAAYPHVWSVDNGNNASEIIVQWVSIKDVRQAYSLYKHGLAIEPNESYPFGAYWVIDLKAWLPKVESPDGKEERDPAPIAWIQFHAIAEFADGGVIFRSGE